MTNLRLSEVFYSLQGEGNRAGEVSLFLRLTGCSAKHACFTSGVKCDTEFESGEELTALDLQSVMIQAIMRVAPKALPLKTHPWIIWTGGEPLDQLTPEIIRNLHTLGWERHAIETSGVVPMSLELAQALTYITISPKVAEHVLVKHFPWTSQRPIDELRYVRHAGQPGIPIPSLTALNYYLSPHSDGYVINKDNVTHCLQLCLENPTWKLSVQQHKLWGVL